MSQVITWTCDRCKKTWNSDEDKDPLRQVSVAAYFGGRRDTPKDEWTAQWCEECRIETGIFRPQPVEKEQPDLPEPLTLEEMIREIVQEEIQNS